MKPYLYEDLSAEVNVTDNHFNENTGNFVANVGLQEGSDSQRMFFMRNVLEKNVISEPFPNLNPRSRVAAVLCVSSSNTQTVRNNLLNPNSRYEIGSHVEGHNLIINASLNFFGKRLTVDEKTAEIYSRIFDRKNRYNLAQVEFLPYRTRKMDFNTNELISYDRERDKFISIIKDQKLGGEIRGEFILEPGVYQVVDDIYVRPGAKFVIAPETTLNFDQSVGLMVQGKLEAVGRTYQQIRFTGSGTITNPAPPVITPPRANNVAALDSKFSRIMKAPTYTPRNTNTTNPPLIEIVLKSDKNKSNATVSQRAVDFQLPTNRTKRAIAGSTVRLSNRFEGKLEVLIDGQWGGVCSYGFDIIDAAIACQQMGLTLNSRDWLLETSQYANSYSHNAAISNLKCSLVDFDITSCPSEKVVKGDFTPSACPLEVGIRCHAPSWSGVRLGILADESVMEYAIIEKAGLLDYGANAFKPALQVDFMKHRLKNLTVSGNGDSGIGILWTDLFSDDDLVTLRGYRVANNFQHGIVSRSQGLRIVESEISGNRESGFHYEPMMDSTEQLELMSWIAPVQPDALIVYPTAADDQRKVIKLDQTRRSSWFLKLSEKPPKQFCSSVVIETGVGHSIGVIVLNPVSELATDRLSVSNIANSFSWDLKSNLSSFPMLTYAYKLNLTYCSGDQPRGGVMLYLSVKRLPSDIYARRDSLVDQERSENLRIKSIHLTDNFISRNGRGFSANHYSRDVGHLETDYGNYYHRHDNETIRLNNNVIERSTKESIYISAPFYEPREAALAEINYTLINNRVIENGRGIVQYSRDIRNSNNLFHWHLVANIIEENRGSGILIRLPYVWQFNENYTHSIVMADNTIIRNRNFMLLLDGHYAEVNITGNMFSDNHCHEGLFRLGWNGEEDAD
ncbi:Protein bark beetle [Halotydeus destructor]|nr:Protein bark beetle [Halotydeus destructor]